MPEGHFDYQDKLMMTRFENEQWLIQSGKELKSFDTEYGKIAISICYDSEFPLLVRKQVEAGWCVDFSAQLHGYRRWLPSC
jgi:predicted amidohydrolase